MNLIETRGLSIGYDQALINDIELGFESACFYALKGDNGTGKTTLVKTLCGIIPSLSGTINYHVSPSEIAFVAQDQELNTYMPCTVLEFIQLGAFQTKSFTKDKLHSILNEMNLNDIKEQSIWTLSGGQLRRTILARALFCESKFMILDEPLAALDHDSSIQFIDILQKAKTTFGLSILMISHNLNLLDEIADKSYLIEDKKLKLIDTEEDR